MQSANIAIVTAHNDMLSAHQPYAAYPDLIKQSLQEMGCTGQIAAGVPAMCDGVTQGRPGMELSLLSRDLIAQCTAVVFGPLKDALDGFMDRTQTHVNGVVRLRLHKGNAIVTGRGSSDSSLYAPEMASYGSEDQFDHRAAEGFIYIWGLPIRLWSAARRR